MCAEKERLYVAIKELSELQKELCKHLCGEWNITSIIEEMADVSIAMDELEAMFGNVKSIKVERVKCLKK